MKYEPAETWDAALEKAGETLRPDATDGTKQRVQTLARTYEVNSAARRLNLKRGTIEESLILELLPSFVDPEGAVRIPAEAVETIATDKQAHERLAAYEIVSSGDVATVADMNMKTIKRKLKRIGADSRRPEWGEVRGLWGLPHYFTDFKEQLKIKEREYRESVQAEQAEKAARKADEKRRREELKALLLAAFPEWTREQRSEQEIILHVGPPNSGKTHDALQALTAAGSGWYLAPLRLLAYEIFDRLNSAGIPCDLLTGEEYIPVEGATYTAATIEMFNSSDSGDCIIIDEAQMLANSDRGWAWTRAMIDASCSQIHMIAPHSARPLIEEMAQAAQLSLTVQEHKRLTPIQVADKPWSLRDLPPHTILVAFSRRRVLELKDELERRGRSVSVVYGSLPPEVRRKQSERFAAGETEICVATDAVGMGLNLPADNVCFYEIDKFDGRNVRRLHPEEIQQIGGRAGRYGLSEGGYVGATSRNDLKYVKRQFYKKPPNLTHARVAPQLQDLEIIPGSLAERLVEWSRLRSIPPALRSIVKVADLEERVSLAQMLSDEEVDQLGLAAAVKLINAPTRESTRTYWRQCAKAIIDMKPMPLPPKPAGKITNTRDLDDIEFCIACADIYMWLAHRPEFKELGERLNDVREQRRQWSESIDEALLKRIKNVKSCSQCGKILPGDYRYGMCQECFQGRFEKA
ncbi:MAG: helicase-related protein [Chloroflexota bacterium]